MYIEPKEKLEQLSRSLLGAYPQQVKARMQAAPCRKAVGLHRNMRVLLSTEKRQSIPPHSRNHSEVRTINQEFRLDLMLLHRITFLLFLKLDNLDKLHNPKINVCCTHEMQPNPPLESSNFYGSLTCFYKCNHSDKCKVQKKNLRSICMLWNRDWSQLPGLVLQTLLEVSGSI